MNRTHKKESVIIPQKPNLSSNADAQNLIKGCDAVQKHNSRHACCLMIAKQIQIRKLLKI
jgi:hypothetical protein